jgi:hypothetical protein
LQEKFFVEVRPFCEVEFEHWMPLFIQACKGEVRLGEVR